MLTIFINFLLLVLILVSIFMVVVILLQRANSNAGMGSAFGGGAAESAFGAETTNVLTKATKWAGIAFFGLCLLLYVLYMARAEGSERELEAGAAPLEVEVVTEETAAAAPVEEGAAVIADEAASTESEGETPAP